MKKIIFVVMILVVGVVGCEYEQLNLNSIEVNQNNAIDYSCDTPSDMTCIDNSVYKCFEGQWVLIENCNDIQLTCSYSTTISLRYNIDLYSCE